MKIILTIIFFSIIQQFNIYSQNKFGNEWINYNQNYLKIVIDQSGIYRIGKSDLDKNGFDTNKLNPQNLQLFFRGKEMAILINGENDKKFDESDFIEFYAMKNDGIQDSLVYRPNNSRPNKYLSLYTKKTAYFLTYNENNLGKRISENKYPEIVVEPESFYISEITKVFDEDWNYDIGTGGIPSLIQSYFEPNETLVSAPIKFQGGLTQYSENIEIKDFYSNEKIPLTFESAICSRYDAKKVISFNVNNQIKKIPSENFKIENIFFEFKDSQINQFPIDLKIESSNSNNILDGKKFDMVSIINYNIRYPRKPVYNENNAYEIQNKSQENSFLKLANAVPNVVGYEINDIYNQKKVPIIYNEEKKEIHLAIEKSTNNSKIWLTSKPSIPLLLERVIFHNNNIKSVNYIIITDSSLLSGANNYKNYRESIIGGNFKVFIGEKQKIYDEFCFGERNPIAIRRFLDFMFLNSNPKFLFLIGKSRSAPVINKSNEFEDLMPTFGYPGSDVLLSAGLNGKSIDIQSIPTGRLSALNNSHINDYLNKVIAYESNHSKVSWKKNILHLGGGRGEGQINEFKSFLSKLGDISKNSKVGGNFKMYNKSNALVGTENIDISREINEGVGIVTFFGHSSSLALDLNIGFVSDPQSNFKNGPNYPFMFFNGCAAGNVFVKAQSLTNDWIITPNKGAIAVLAHSFLSYSNTNTTYMEKLYRTWFSSIEMLNNSIGEVVMQVNEDLIKSNPNDIYMVANTQQMILQGDPSVKIFNFNKPDFEISDEKMFVISDTPNKSIFNASKIKVGLIAENLGIYDKDSKVSVKLKVVQEDNSFEEQLIKIQSFGTKDTIIFTINKDKNFKSIEISFDSDFKIDEINEDNNSAKLIFNWAKLNSLEYYSTSPFEDKVNPVLNIKYNNNLMFDGIKLKSNDIINISLIDNLSLGNKSDKITVFLKMICESCNESLKSISLNSITGGPNEIFSVIKLANLEAGNYQLYIQGFDAKSNTSGEVLVLNFIVESEEENFKLSIKPNPLSLYTVFELFAPNEVNYELNIFNTEGKMIFKRIDKLNLGINNLFWDAKDNQFNVIPNGLYFYSLQVNSEKPLNFSGKILVKN